MGSSASDNDLAAPPDQTAELNRQWIGVLDQTASRAGLSLLLVAGHQPPSLHVANNNSICAAFQASERHAHRCEPFCGQAFNMAADKGDTVYYSCHAGLRCATVPVADGVNPDFAVITGRAFTKGADFRQIAERIRCGDLQDLQSDDLFSNVIFGTEFAVETAAKKIRKSAQRTGVRETLNAPPAELSVQTAGVSRGELAVAGFDPFAMPGSSIPSLNAAPSGPAIRMADLRATVDKFKFRNDIESVAVVVGEGPQAQVEFVSGIFSAGDLQLDLNVVLNASRARLLAREPLNLRQQDGILLPVPSDSAPNDDIDIILFPLLVNAGIMGALLLPSHSVRNVGLGQVRTLIHTLEDIISGGTVDAELDNRTELKEFVSRFAETVTSNSPSVSYKAILRMTADIMRAGRSSLWIHNENTEELVMKAYEGDFKDLPADARLPVGEGIAGAVLKEGQPLVVRDTENYGLGLAGSRGSYSSKSFISFPISIAGRKVGVLNLTEKTDGGAYGENHIALLKTVIPHIAIAIDRTEWQEKANQYELMSITDALTGLLNRRYLENRMAEELNRFRRTETPACFLMLDIDDFKRYNDRNGHPAGDVALEMTAQCMKSVLRSEDVAARYGGEEFCILLPQTQIDEAWIIAERIRNKIATTEYPGGRNQPLGIVSVSIGVAATSRSIDSTSALIDAADRALYVAKSLGKNRIQVDEESQREAALINAE